MNEGIEDRMSSRQTARGRADGFDKKKRHSWRHGKCMKREGRH